MATAGEPSRSTSRRPPPGPAPVARYQPLVTVAIAVATGITLDRWVVGPTARAASNTIGALYVWWWLLSVSSLVGWTWLRRCNFHGAACASLLVAVSAAGAAWHHLGWRVYDRWEVARYATAAGAPAGIMAVALERPRTIPAPPPSPYRAIPQGERSRMRTRILAIRDGTQWTRASGHCEVLTDGHLLGVHAGDQLRIVGNLRRLQPALNPGEFDYSLLARADRRLAGVIASSPDCVQIASGTEGGSLRRLFGHLRFRAQQYIWQYMDPQRAPLASAILLGQREALTRDQTKEYLLTGTVHFLVVSGLHVGILAMGMYGAMRCGLLPRRTSLVCIMLLVVFYALLTGAKPPVVRAAVLVVLMCVAHWTGRRAVALNSLAAAALVVLAMNPADLFRVGPQLSFLAVAALIWLGEWVHRIRSKAEHDPLQRLLEQARPWYAKVTRAALRSGFWSLLATAAVWLTVLPLVMSQFHVVAPIAILISPLAWVSVFFALLSGFGLLLWGGLVPPLAAFCGRVCDAALVSLEWIVDLARAAPAGHLWVPGPATWWIVGLYLGLIGLRVLHWPAISTLRQVGLLAIWILVGVLPGIFGFGGNPAMQCDFLALGHGGCVVLRTPSKQTIIYDAGSLTSPDYAAQTVSSYLWSQGIRRIDGIVLSHADVDHFNAVPGLLERFDVAAVFVSPVMFDGFDASAGAHSAPAQLEKSLQSRQVLIKQVFAGDRLRLGSKLHLEVLHPPRRGLLAGDNANSVVLSLEFAGRRILLPGDLQSPGLEAVLAELPLDCDILMAPHHGSRSSDPPGFAAWCKPEWVVISGSRVDAIADVVETYEAAGAQVYRTGFDGAIRCVVEANGQVSVAAIRERE